MTTNNKLNTSPVQYNVQTGGPSGTLSNVAPSANPGEALVSTGASSQPDFGLMEVAGGGTGLSTVIPYEIFCGGTITTNPWTQVTSVGATNQLLTASGSAVLPTWQNQNAGLISIVVQVFTSSGTYTPTTGIAFATLECLGAGGGGGGAVNSLSGAVSVGGGGGAGGYSRKTVTAATLGSSQTITIGAGGNGGTSSGGNGSTGGASSIGSLISATSGTGGIGNPTQSLTQLYSAGGTPGIGSGGDINCEGQPGSPGFGTVPTASHSYGISGKGGRSYFGGSGFSVGSAGSAASATDGTDAFNYGGGGSGGCCLRSAAATIGGDGSAGLIVITEFII